MVYEVLVACEFGSVVATHRAVEVARCGIVEGAHSKVGHSVAEAPIGHNLTVGLGGLYGCLGGPHKVAPRKVAHIHANHIHPNEHSHKGQHHSLAHLAPPIEGNHTCGEEHKHQRPYSIAHEHRGPLALHCGQHIGRQAHLPVIGGLKGEHCPAEEYEYKRKASQNGSRLAHSHKESAPIVIALPNAPQHQCAQQGHTPLHHHKGCGYGSELVVGG